MSALGGGVHTHEGPPRRVGFGDINADGGGTAFASVGLDVIGIDCEHGATSAYNAKKHSTALSHCVSWESSSAANTSVATVISINVVG